MNLLTAAEWIESALLDYTMKKILFFAILFAFAGCVKLNKVTFNNAPKELSFKMFYGCVSLKEITIPKSVEKIDKWAFLDCYSLEKVTLLNENTLIDAHAFDNCNSVIVEKESEK